MRKIIIALFIISPLMLFCQEKKCNYYSLIRKAETKIIENNLDSSLFFYNEAFVTYNFPFAKDIYAASCVAHYANDTSTLYKYIDLLLKKGMSVKFELRYFINLRPNDKKILKYFNDAEYYSKQYKKSIDTTIGRFFLELDKQNQIKIFDCDKNYKNYSERLGYIYRTDSIHIFKFIELCKKYGITSERKLGIGSYISMQFTNIGLKKLEGKYYEYISNPDIRKNKGDSVFFNFAYESKSIQNTSIFRLVTRRGNSLLWHIDIKQYPKLNDILLEGVNNCEVYPTFYAACIERRGGEYALAMGSKINWKYKFDIKKIIKDQMSTEINKRREQIGIRSLEMDLQLFRALQKLEGLKYKNYFKTRVKGNSLFFQSLYTSRMP